MQSSFRPPFNQIINILLITNFFLILCIKNVNSSLIEFNIDENVVFTQSALMDGPGKLTKLGKGEFALTYNEANTFMGGTEIQDGTVSVSNSDSLSTGLVKFDSTNGTPALKTLACVDIQNTIDISDCTAILIATAPTTLSGLLSTTTASILNVTGGQEANFIGDQSTAFKVVVSGEATRVPIGDNFKEGTTFTYGEGTIISSHVHYIPYQIFIG